MNLTADEEMDTAPDWETPQCTRCAAYTTWDDTHCPGCGETFNDAEAAA
jgi:RNA polymerase subunit RPABC4/transcription elongation factor Spt4